MVFHCTIVDAYCVKAAKGEREIGKMLVVKVLPSVTKTNCQQPLTLVMKCFCS